MDLAEEQIDAGYTLEQLVEIAEMTSDEAGGSWAAANDEHDAPWESFINEIDAWAQHALAANGFGDY